MRIEKEYYEKVLQHLLTKLDLGIDEFVDKYPHVSSNCVYSGEENTLWTSSFYPGICYLAYEITKDNKYLAHSERY